MSLAEPLAPVRAKPRAAARPLSKAAVRKLIFDLHLWVGIALSVWFVLLGLTGALLVFKPQVDALLHPGLLRSRPAPAGAQPLGPDAALAAAKAAYPQASFKRLAYPAGSQGVFELRFGAEKAEREIFVDAYTGAVLGERAHKGHLLEQVLELHKALLLGKNGEQANGIGALLLVGLIATGIYLWWPANAKQWPQRLKVKTGASTKRLLFDLHNAFGIYTLPVLLVIAVTGAVFIYKKPVARVVYGLTGTPLPQEKKERYGQEHGGKEKARGEKPHRKQEQPAEQAVFQVASLVVASEAAAPGTRLKHVDLPEKPGKPVRVHRERHTGFRVNNKVRVELHPVTGALLKVEDERADPLGKRLMRWNGPLHEGRWAGLGTQWLYVLIALVTPLGLVVTGTMKWWQTRQSRARNRNRQPGASHKERS